MHQVFVSYSSKEITEAFEIVERLEACGIPCWIAPRNIRIGSNYTEDIPGAIRDCSFFILVHSKKAQKSKWVKKELTRAVNHNKRVFPLSLEDFSANDTFDFLLEDIQIRDYYKAKSQILDEVIREIQGPGYHAFPPEVSSDTHDEALPETLENNNRTFLPETLPPTFDEPEQNPVRTHASPVVLNSAESLRIPFARDFQDREQYLELGTAAAPHAFLLGTSGCGKSTALHTMLLQTVKQYHPDDVEILALDCKGIEFRRYKNNKPPHYRELLVESYYDLSPRSFIDFLYSKAKLRMRAFQRAGLSNIVEYQVSSPHSMPRILILIDDCDLLFQSLDSDELEGYLERFEKLLRIAPTVGISFVFSSQSPFLLELSPGIRELISTHLYFRCHPRTLNSLLGKKYAAVYPHGIPILQRGQCLLRSPALERSTPDRLPQVNVLYIDTGEAEKIIQQANAAVGQYYFPKDDITL